ncbi:hypothetical protein I5I91_14470, partial [Pseudomonas aeruginosa]|nr:hypothetical protein [Pseudomonas aeruginosa]
MVHFSDAGQPGRTVLTTFAPTLSTSEAHVRLQLCYPLLFPQRLSAVRVYPLLPGGGARGHAPPPARPRGAPGRPGGGGPRARRGGGGGGGRGGGG